MSFGLKQQQISLCFSPRYFAISHWCLMLIDSRARHSHIDWQLALSRILYPTPFPSLNPAPLSCSSYLQFSFRFSFSLCDNLHNFSIKKHFALSSFNCPIIVPRNLYYQRALHTHRGLGGVATSIKWPTASPVREQSIMTSIPFRIQKANHSSQRKRESEISRIIAASQRAPRNCSCRTSALSVGLPGQRNGAAYSHIIVRFLFAPLRRSCCCYCNNLGIIFISPARAFICNFRLSSTKWCVMMPGMGQLLNTFRD